MAEPRKEAPVTMPGPEHDESRERPKTREHEHEDEYGNEGSRPEPGRHRGLDGDVYGR